MMFQHVPQEDHIVTPRMTMPSGVDLVTDDRASMRDCGWRKFVKIDSSHMQSTADLATVTQ